MAIVYCVVQDRVNVSVIKPVLLDQLVVLNEVIKNTKELNETNITPFLPHKKIKLIPVNDWGKKYRPIRVWCCIKTIYDETQLLIIKETWGKYCDKLLFMMGDVEQNHIEEVNLFHDDIVLNNIIRLKLKYTGANVTFPKKDIWEKCWKTYQYLYRYHRDEFDWVITTDNDAWFSTYNFKGYAQYFDPNQSWYMGHTLTNAWRYRKRNCVFNAGGAFALSVGSIRKLNRIFETSEFLNGRYSEMKCTAFGSWKDDTHIGICLKSIGIFPINSLDTKHRLRWSIFTRHSVGRREFSRTTWYWKDRYENSPTRKRCCAQHAIAFHYYKNITLRRKYFMGLDEMYTEKSKHNWVNHTLPPKPTTFLFNTSFDEFDEYFNIKKPPKGQKIWKGVDNLWNYTNI